MIFINGPTAGVLPVAAQVLAECEGPVWPGSAHPNAKLYDYSAATSAVKDLKEAGK